MRFVKIIVFSTVNVLTLTCLSQAKDTDRLDLSSLEEDDDDDDDDDNELSEEEYEAIFIRRLFMAHGTCAATAWALLVPLAVSSSVLRTVLEKSCGINWFPVHRGLNLTAILLTMAAVGLAVITYSLDDDDPHFVDDPHHTVGIIILLACIFQGVNGILRPHLPAQKPLYTTFDGGKGTGENESSDSPGNNDPPGEHVDDPPGTTSIQPRTIASNTHQSITSSSNSKDNEEASTKKSTIRVLWEYLHRTWGVLLLATTWWQIQSGLFIFFDEYDGPDLRPSFWIFVGSISCLVFLLFIYQSAVLKRADN